MYDEFDEIELNNLLIVDSLNYAFKYKHKGTKNFASFFIRDLASFAKSYKADKVIVLGDGGSKYRKEIYPEYKANRVYDESEREEFEEFLAEYNKALELCNYPVLKFNGVEADDLAAMIVDTVHEEYDNIWLLSTDKDWDLLLKDNVHRFSYINRREVTIQSFEEQYGYPPEMHLSVKCLQGDKGDNVTGVAGIGEKRAYALIRQYGTAYDIAAAIPIPGNQKFITELNMAKDLILRNYDLFDLLETYNAAIGIKNIEKVKEVLWN